MSARGIWDAAKHPHGVHGHWASVAGGGKVARRVSDEDHIAGQRRGAFQPRAKAGQRRTDKRHLQQRLEVARGLRSPRDFRERDMVEYQSPRKQAEQLAKTGDVRMPRQEAIRSVVRASRSGAQPTMGTKTTFSGQKRRVRGIAPEPGTRMTARGRYNLAKGRD